MTEKASLSAKLASLNRELFIPEVSARYDPGLDEMMLCVQGVPTNIKAGFGVKDECLFITEQIFELLDRLRKMQGIKP